SVYTKVPIIRPWLLPAHLHC
ncbi:unnamed protein product, partial [Callosobruchus maculatus]